MTRAVEANQEAFTRLTTGRPGAGRRPAGRPGGPGHDRRRRSSPRAPRCPGTAYYGGQRRAVLHAAVYEELAADTEEAEAAIRAGRDPAGRLPRPRLRRVGGRHLHRLHAGAGGGERPLRQPRLLQPLRGRVPQAPQLRRLRRRRPARPGLPGRVAGAAAERGPAALRRHPPGAADPAGPAHGRRAPQPQHRRHPAVHPRAVRPAAGAGRRRLGRRDRRRPGLPARGRLLLPALLHGRGQGDGRRRRRGGRLQPGHGHDDQLPGVRHPGQRARPAVVPRAAADASRPSCSRASPPTTSSGSAARATSPRRSASAASPRRPPSASRPTRAAGPRR